MNNIDHFITQSQLIEKLRDKISDLQDKLIDTLMRLRLTEAENFHLKAEAKEEAGEEAKDIITCANIPTLTCQKCNKKMICLESSISTENFKYKIGSITGKLEMKCIKCDYICKLLINENHVNMIIKEYYKNGGKEIKEGSDPVYLQD
jgi:hypothetical protein